MSITHNPARQTELVIEEELSLAELASECIIAKLPAGATLTGIVAFLDTNFNGGTTATLSIGDSGSAVRYASAVNVQTGAGAGLTLVATQFGRKYTSADYVRATFAQTGTPATTGSVRIAVKYIREGRATEVQQ